MSKVIDLKGQKFGRLTVLERAPSTGGQAEWICECECGNIKKVKSQHLRNGMIISCGCFNKEVISKARTVNLKGKRYGKLTVVEYVGSKNGRAVWKCKCDCGNTVNVYSSYLRTGDTKSCGCVMSYREVRIERYLKEHKVLYKRQFTFPDLRGKKYPLRFDFAIFNKDASLRCLIEYQGEQHFNNIFKLPAEIYEQTLERDRLKKDYCLLHNIALFELTNDDNLELELRDILYDNSHHC